MPVHKNLLSSPHSSNPGNEFLWMGMLDPNTHTLLYERGYRTLGCIAAKTETQLKADGFDAHEIASMGRLLSSRELAIMPLPETTPATEPDELSFLAHDPATDVVTVPSTAPIQLESAA